MATRAQIRTRTLRWCDAYNPDGTASGRWDTTAGGEVDQRLGVVHAREWRRILNANPYYRIAERTVTLDSNGRFDIDDLTYSSGSNDCETFYRILALSKDNRVYEEIAFVERPLGSENNDSGFVWFRYGEQIQVLPYTTGDSVTVWVNHIPCRVDTLDTDSADVEFPSGYEDILCLEAAAMLLAKGGAETGASAELSALAEQSRQDMLQDFARISIKPLRMKAEDTAAEWGG